MRTTAWWICALTLLLTVLNVHGKTSKKQELLLKEAQKSPSGVLRLTESTYDTLLAAPRDYSVFIVLTATNPRFQCAACKLIEDPFKQVSNGWNSRKDRDKLVFAVAEADEATNLFRRLGLTHVPVMSLYKPAPNGKAPAPISYDVSLNGYGTDDLTDFLHKHLDVKIKPKKPIFTEKTLMILCAIVIGGGFMAYMAVNVNVDHGVRGVAMVICIGLIFTFTSGYMWNAIRNPPFMLANRDGSPQFFAPGFQTQNGVESSILIALYAGLVLSILALTNVASSITYPMAQRLVIVLGLILFLGLFSALIMVFDVKSPGYPFRLFL